MRDEVPAALALIFYVAGLAAAPILIDARTALWLTASCALLLWAIGRRRAAITAAFAALGLLIGLSEMAREQAEVGYIRSLDEEVFATVDAELGRDWMHRGTAQALIVSAFAVNGREIDAPLRIYVRFDPPPMGMHVRVRAEGFVRQNERGHFTMSVKSPRLIGYSGTLWTFDPERWNRTLTHRVRQFADRYPTEVALIEALALGRGESLSADTRESFRRGGTYHLLVFSGLQIAFAAAVIAALLRFVDAPRLSDWSLLAFAVIAPLFIGPTASVSRASLGIALYALSRIAHRPTSLANLWCVSALLRLIAVPTDLSDVAFQLTYAGAGALLFIGKPIARTRLRWMAYAIAAEIAITPLTLYHFHQYALGGSLLTIAMTPIVFAMLVLSAAFCATAAEPLLQAIGVLNSICGVMNGASASFSGFAAAPPLAAVVAGFALATAAIPFSRWRGRTAAIIAMLLIPSAATLVIGRRLRSVEHPRVTILDVGQGDAILARSGRRTMLVDAGGRHDDPRFAEATLIPLLADRGVRRIDVAVLTHPHPDHCGGMPSVLAHLAVGELWISPRNFRGPCAQRLLEVTARRQIPVRLVRGAADLSLGDLRVRVWPADRHFRKSPENNGSLVLRVEANGRRVLLTGDIEREREMLLWGDEYRADVLKVAHHGSRSSSTPPFLDRAGARVAVISCGRRNLFRHPHPLILAALQSRDMRVLRTDRHGDIDIDLREGRVAIVPQIDTLSSEP